MIKNYDKKYLTDLFILSVSR